jgi:hypothetical protein
MLRGIYKLGLVPAAILIALPLFAQMRITALLTITGHATVKGTNVPATTAVVPGDRIQTASDSAAALSLPGSSVTLSANSDVTFRGEALEVQGGTTDVTTSRGLRAEIDRIIVTPDRSSPARFEIARLENSIVITAKSGPLTLTGAEAATLEPGKSAVIKTGANLADTRAPSRSTLSTKVIAAAGVGGGGATVASSMATRKRAEDSSPVHP